MWIRLPLQNTQHYPFTTRQKSDWVRAFGVGVGLNPSHRAGSAPPPQSREGENPQDPSLIELAMRLLLAAVAGEGADPV